MCDVRCTACGESIPDASRFCPSCGARIAVLGEERRIVTVVFADIVGFTSLSERRDPEQVKHLVDRSFRWLTDEIVSFGGRVDKIVGDAILALFGAPVAHEDDAERAVRAALRMQQILDERADQLDGVVRLRIGINTGEVLVGALAAGGDYTAMGDVVNTASRLQTAAQPGEVLVGQTTYAATERVIPYLERGIVPAKGRFEPVRAWSASQPTTAPGERPGRTVGPLIGRAEEVAVLDQVASTALASDRAALLVLLGDAGMGKSRIIAEVTASLERSRDAVVLEGRCVPYGEVNAWWPLADALRGALPADAGDPVEVVEPRLHELVGATASPERTRVDLQRTATGLLQLFGFSQHRVPAQGTDPDRIRDEVTHCFITLLEDLTTTRPVVLWLSDLHWADPVVHELVEAALEVLARRPLVVVVTARRSLLAQWRPPVGRFDTFALNLEALDTDATDALIEALVRESGGPVMSESGRSDLRERSGGNPLFLIELLALLGEQGTGDAEVTAPLSALPDTLRGLVAARLDNLGPDERAVVDDASVLGRRGRVEHLAEMARQIRGTHEIDAALAAVNDRELLRLSGDTWEFTSDVTREVAYGMLTKSDRAKKHLGVAKWVESTRGGPATDRVADLLAHHYGRAAELLDDLGTVENLSDDIRARALHWIDDVSARGERMRLLPAVERVSTQGLALAGEGFESVRLTLLLRRAAARSQARQIDGATADAAAAGELAETLGDDAARAAVRLVEGEIAQQSGDLDTARATFADAARRFDEAGDTEGRAEALRALGLSELFAGRTAEAEVATSDALEAFRELGRPSGEAWALQNLAWISFAQGRIAEAERRIAESLELFESMGNTGGTAWARGLQGFVRLADGDLVGADVLQRSVAADVDSGGDRWAKAMMQLLGAVVRLWTGRTSEAVDMAASGLDLFREVHDRFGQARVVWPLARGLAMRGDFDAARQVLADVRETMDLAPVGRLTAEDQAVFAVARAAVEVHVGHPEAALEVMASVTDEFGLSETASWLRGGGRDAPPVDEMVRAMAAGTSIDLVTVVVMACLQTGRVAGAGAILAASAAELGPLRHSAPVQAVEALVEVASGRTDEACRMATEVLRDERASYLDRTLAGIATALAAARIGDLDAVGDAFSTARAAVDHTGDLLTRAVVRLVETRVFDAVASGSTNGGSANGEAPTDRTTDAARHLADMGTDAHGWLALVDGALGGEPSGQPAAFATS